MLEYVLSQFSKKHVAIIGDIMLDVYARGVVERISAEAPVPVVWKQTEDGMLGGAGITACNVVSLCGTCTLAGVLGNDQYGARIQKILDKTDVHLYFLEFDNRSTTVKYRIVAGENHQLLRVDIEDITPLGDGEAEQLFIKMEQVLIRSNVIVLSDYAKGCLTPYLVRRITEYARTRGISVIADCKPNNLHFFSDVDVLCPNEKEAREMVAVFDGSIEDVGKCLRERVQGTVIITCDSRGVYVFTKEGAIEYIPALKVEARGVSGAGDTFVAALALSLASSADVISAARIATIAGGLAASKLQTTALTLEELSDAV